MTYEELTYRRNDSVEGDVYVKKYELFQVFASMPFHSESSIKELAAKIAEIAVETHSSGKDLVLSDIDFNEDERPSPHRRRIEITRQKVMVFGATSDGDEILGLAQRIRDEMPRAELKQ